jgi:phage terminase large subunit
MPIIDLEKLNGPLIPNIIKMYMKSQKGSKDMYNILNSNLIKLKCEEKWTEENSWYVLLLREMQNVIYKTSIFANISSWNGARLVIAYKNW